MVNYKNRKTRYQIILLPLFFTFILTTMCYATDNNNILKLREEMRTMVGQLKLEIELDKHVYSIGEPIAVQCSIINVGKNIINLGPVLFNDLEIYLKYEDDKEPILYGPIILLKELIRKEGIIKLEPEHSYSFVRKIDEKAYVIPPRIGKYELYAVYQNRMDDLEGVKLWTGEAKSNIVKFEIVRK